MLLEYDCSLYADKTMNSEALKAILKWSLKQHDPTSQGVPVTATDPEVYRDICTYID